MATKTQTQTAINSALPLKINKIKTIASLDVIVDELYRTQIIDTQATTNIVTLVQTGITYNIRFKKSGNSVNISGTLVNTNGFALSNVTLMDISNTEYRANNATTTAFYIYSSNNIAIGLTPVFNNIFLSGTLNAGQAIFFSGSYITNS